MNDSTDKSLPALASKFDAGPQAPMPTALALYLDDKLYERVSHVAIRMSKAGGFTPKHLSGQPEACFAVVSRAITWRLDPFAVAMATYQTPGGQIGFEGKLIHAILENSGRLDPAAGGIRYEHYGDWSKVQGKFKIIEKPSDGDRKERKYAVATWSDDDARAGKPTDPKYPLAQSCGVRVIAHLRGEREPRMIDFDLIQAQPRNSTLWATDPMTQICYTAVRRFGSVVASALLMGVPFDPVDQMQHPGEIDITGAPTGDIPLPTAKAKPVPHDVDPLTGEVATTVTPAASEAATPGVREAHPQHATAGPSAAASEAKASEGQRKTIQTIAARGGISPEKLDEQLIEKFSMGIDQLPMSMVNKAIQFVKTLLPAEQANTRDA